MAGKSRSSVPPMGETVTGAVLIGVPILFNVGFTLLAQRFDYPDILRRPTHEVLERFRAGGSSLLLIWWVFALSGVLLAPLVVLLATQLGDADGNVVAVSVAVGVLASAVQFLGMIRWPFLVPYLAREAARSGPNSARGEAVDVAFQSFNRYLGVAVGEHLGYALTGAGRSLPVWPRSRAMPFRVGSALSVWRSDRCSWSPPLSFSGASSPPAGNSPAS